jgi:tRNA dimethylallyltransferase
MHEALLSIDPATAARLSPNDSQRIQRALEIWHISGKTMSELLSAPEQTDKPLATITLSLEPTARSHLHQRIALRFDQMLEEGLVEEVKALRERGDLHTDLPSIRCVGYRQFWSMLAGEVTSAQAKEQAIAATRQLAKRQLTWLRSLPDRITVEADSHEATEKTLAIVGRLIDDRTIVD